MSSGSSSLTREGIALGRYLVGSDPTQYMLDYYCRCLAADEAPTPAIDRLLLSLARFGPFPTRMADGYARFFRPGGELRRRLTLMLAILESAPPAHRAVHSAPTGRPADIFLRLVGQLAVGAIATILGLLVCGPIHLVSAILPRGSR